MLHIIHFDSCKFTLKIVETKRQQLEEEMLIYLQTLLTEKQLQSEAVQLKLLNTLHFQDTFDPQQAQSTFQIISTVFISCHTRQ